FPRLLYSLLIVNPENSLCNQTGGLSQIVNPFVPLLGRFHQKVGDLSRFYRLNVCFVIFFCAAFSKTMFFLLFTVFRRAFLIPSSFQRLFIKSRFSAVSALFAYCFGTILSQRRRTFSPTTRFKICA